MLENDVKIWEVVLKTITVLIGIFGFLYQLIGFDPQKRRKLKTDLEILERIKEHKLNEEYLRILNDVKARIPGIYREPKETDTVVRIPDLKRLIIGIVLTTFFSILTVYYYFENSGFQWWMAITVFLIFSGLGNILQGISDRHNK